MNWGFDRAQAQYDAAYPAHLDDDEDGDIKDDGPDPDDERDRLMDMEEQR